MRFRVFVGMAVAILFAGCAQVQPTRLPWDRLYVFGDSYSDTGAGYVDGDGPTAVAYMARELGVPFTHARDPNAAGKGLNFAVSGAQTGWSTGRNVKDALLGYGMRNQVRDFVTGVHTGAIKFSPDTTLFFLAGGLNDRQLPGETTRQNLEDEIRSLYDVGARHFYVALLPTKIPAFAAVGQRLNPVLTQLPATLYLEGSTVELSHWGAFFDEVMDNPQRYGITNTKDACAGRAIFDQDTTEKGDPATFYFYHAGHPSTAVHRIVGHKLAEEVTAGRARR